MGFHTLTSSDSNEARADVASARNFVFARALNLLRGAVDVMSFCSTCKRLVPDKNRRSDRKTCRACLRSSAARSRRYRAQGRTGKGKCDEGTRRYCSSCKCAKFAAHFVGKKKSCVQCLTKRQLANSAKEVNSWQGEIFTNMIPPEFFDLVKLDAETSTQSAVQLPSHSCFSG